MNFIKSHWHAYSHLQKQRAKPAEISDKRATETRCILDDVSNVALRARVTKQLGSSGGRRRGLRPGVPGMKRPRLEKWDSVPDLTLLRRTLAPYGLSRARVHGSWSDFVEPPLPKVAEAPEDWQARVGWAGRFEKRPARVVTDPAKPHLLGRGKSAHVVRMRDRLTGRDVAVKKFTDRVAGSGDAAYRARNEFDVSHSLRHPGIVAPSEIAVDKERGKAFLVYRLVDGVTLAKSPQLDEVVARQVVRDIARALAYMFEQGVTHNDVHGNNVMVHNGRGYLIDFGLASRAADVLHERDMRDFYMTMRDFFPCVRSAQAQQFFAWFATGVGKNKVSRRMQVAPRELLAQLLVHPYMVAAAV